MKQDASEPLGNVPLADSLVLMQRALRRPLDALVQLAELQLQTAPGAARRERVMRLMQHCASLLVAFEDAQDGAVSGLYPAQLAHVRFCLRDCLREELQAAIARSRGKASPLRWEMAPNVPSVLVGDPGRIRQLIRELMDHVLKLERRGKIVVRAKARELASEYALIEFSVTHAPSRHARGSAEQLFDVSDWEGVPVAPHRTGATSGIAAVRQLADLLGARLSGEVCQDGSSALYVTLRLDVVPQDKRSGRSTAGGPAPMRSA